MFQKLSKKIANQLSSTDNLDNKKQEQEIQLPKDFHERQIFCEIKLEKQDVSMEIVQELIDLYSKAVEFYGLQQDDRYLYYKNKMQDLLMRQNVKEAMDRKTEEIRINTEPEEKIEIENKKETIGYSQEKKIKIDLVQKHKELKNKVKYLHTQDQTLQSTKLVDLSQQLYEYNLNLLKKDVETQMDKIEIRREKLKQQNIEKYGFCSPKPIDKYLNDILYSEQPRKKIDFEKMHYTAPKGNIKKTKIDNIKVKQFPQNNDLIDLNFGDDLPVNSSTNNNTDLLDINFDDVNIPNNKKLQNKKDEEDDEEEGEHEDIIFHTHNSSGNTSDQKVYQKQHQVFSLNSQESPQNQLSRTPNGSGIFQLFKKNNNNNQNQQQQQLSAKNKKQQVFLTPNGNTTNQINLIDFNKEKMEAQQKIKNLTKQSEESTDLLDLNIDDNQNKQETEKKVSKTQSIFQQLLSPITQSSNSKQQKQFQSSNKQKYEQQQQQLQQQQNLQKQQQQQNYSQQKYNTPITQNEYSVQLDLQQQQLASIEKQKQREQQKKQQEEMQKKFQNADIQIVDNGEVKKQKKQKSVKKHSTASKQRKQSVEKPANFVIPF